MSTQPTMGRIVHYTLDESDCRSIQAQRNGEVYDYSSDQHNGRKVHVWIGIPVHPGDVFPAMVVRSRGDYKGENIDLQVFLSGNDIHWCTARYETDDPMGGPQKGRWHWPPR